MEALEAVPNTEHSNTLPIAQLTLLVFAVAISVTILLQVLGGAWKAECGGYPDEPAHFMTGLMIRDYLVSGFHKSPIAFAEDYYLHYPKVAFGMWGPLLHICEAIF